MRRRELPVRAGPLPGSNNPHSREPREPTDHAGRGGEVLSRSVGREETGAETSSLDCRDFWGRVLGFARCCGVYSWETQGDELWSDKLVVGHFSMPGSFWAASQKHFKIHFLQEPQIRNEHPRSTAMSSSTRVLRPSTFFLSSFHPPTACGSLQEMKYQKHHLYKLVTKRTDMRHSDCFIDFLLQ